VIHSRIETGNAHHHAAHRRAEPSRYLLTNRGTRSGNEDRGSDRPAGTRNGNACSQHHAAGRGSAIVGWLFPAAFDFSRTDVGMPGEMVGSWYQLWADRGLWENRYAVMSDAAVLSYDSISAAARLTKPLLMVHSDQCAHPDAARRRSHRRQAAAVGGTDAALPVLRGSSGDRPSGREHRQLVRAPPRRRPERQSR
jgi:hypothetical protein